jgi:hypothetical protein
MARAWWDTSPGSERILIRGRRAGAVRPEEGKHFAGANLEIEPVEHDHGAISLGQPAVRNATLPIQLLYR